MVVLMRESFGEKHLFLIALVVFNWMYALYRISSYCIKADFFPGWYSRKIFLDTLFKNCCIWPTRKKEKNSCLILSVSWLRCFQQVVLR